MEAPTPMTSFPSKIDIKNVNFSKEEYKVKLDYEIYNIMIGSLNEYLVIQAYTTSNLKNNYIAYYTYDNLKNISKSMRYFDEIKDIISFIEGKGKQNELLLKKEYDNIFIEFKINTPNGQEENISLKLNLEEINDKEIISNLVYKVNYLEKQVETLNNEVEKNKKAIQILFNEIRDLKKIKEIKEIKEITPIQITNNIVDSKIANDKEIDFIANYLRKTGLFKNKKVNFNLLYRGTRDGDNTINLHQKCDKYKNVIIFMKSEQGNRYGGFSNIGWESREKDNFEYPIDDNAFLFSIDKQKIFKAKKGKNKICWINGDEYGFCFYASLMLKNKFLTRENGNFGKELTKNFAGCTLQDFNSGLAYCKFLELEVFHIS